MRPSSCSIECTGCAIFVVVVLGVVAGQLWRDAWADAQFHSGQEVAVCVDGRLLGESRDVAKFTVELKPLANGNKYETRFQFHCRYPVAAYLCSDDSCEGLPPTPLAVWPERVLAIDLFCDPGSYLGNTCNSKDMDCSWGKCNAWEYALPVCASGVQQSRYGCHVVPDRPDLGVSLEPVGSQTATLVLAGVLMILSVLLACAFLAWLLLSGALSEWFCRMICVGVLAVGVCTATLIIVYKAMKGDNFNFVVSSRVAEAGAPGAVPQQPPARGWSAADTVSLLMFLGTFVCVPLTLFMYARAEAACARDEGDDSSSSGHDSGEEEGFLGGR